ncbi:ABC transporter ATP-binding protein [Halobellus salinus]|uniref:Nickel import system ATP-binding protein NikD n=1 Tax=Halobellus salinus TaxID=931585 RepID=A0A830E884_9EURY|nr:ABC transporter ATP-binding protein [Halobellus salinus]GGI98947.1 ABC transporter ATP-binding protein [Halobellus salinus]SMP05438.1 peptide/nickel transport system ATP-binding protein [Halobellus salinus]
MTDNGSGATADGSGATADGSGATADGSGATTDDPLLAVEGLRTTFETEAGDLVAVDGIDFTVERGETVCLVGESGSGKTVAVESLTGLIDQPPGRIEGSVRFRGAELTALPPKALRRHRGASIAYVFQNPQDALNHCYTVGWQLIEAIQVHEDVSDAAARARAIDLLDTVGVPDPAGRIDEYPHQFSGGEKQRVMIAMALVTEPDLLVADEPTTALDVTTQAGILQLLDDLKAEYGLGVLFVTHDLATVSQIADRVVVLYAGTVMERGPVVDVFERPAHPYTRALLACLPGRESDLDAVGGAERGGIAGSLPDPTAPPDGCRFAPRCAHAESACSTGDQPPEVAVGDGHRVSCIHYDPGDDPSALPDPTESAAEAERSSVESARQDVIGDE